jgi:hypothetical protein
MKDLKAYKDRKDLKAYKAYKACAEIQGRRVPLEPQDLRAPPERLAREPQD